jgi:hypothetical protein
MFSKPQPPRIPVHGELPVTRRSRYEGCLQEQDWLSAGIQTIISNSPETGLLVALQSSSCERAELWSSVVRVVEESLINAITVAQYDVLKYTGK